jgi:hypothetical protein
MTSGEVRQTKLMLRFASAVLIAEERKSNARLVSFLCFRSG